MLEINLEFDRNSVFNEGSDARVLGLDWKDNPYMGTMLSNHKRVWFDGWNHVNLFWGSSVRGRWEVEPLSEIRKG